LPSFTLSLCPPLSHWYKSLSRNCFTFLSFITFKSFCTAKEKAKSEDIAYRMGENLRQEFIHRRLISRIYKELKKLNNKKENNSINGQWN
jgi:hypothetical protein